MEEEDSHNHLWDTYSCWQTIRCSSPHTHIIQHSHRNAGECTTH